MNKKERKKRVKQIKKKISKLEKEIDKLCVFGWKTQPLGDGRDM